MKAKFEKSDNKKLIQKQELNGHNTNEITYEA